MNGRMEIVQLTIVEPFLATENYTRDAAVGSQEPLVFGICFVMATPIQEAKRKIEEAERKIEKAERKIEKAEREIKEAERKIEEAVRKIEAAVQEGNNEEIKNLCYGTIERNKGTIELNKGTIEWNKETRTRNYKIISELEDEIKDLKRNKNLQTQGLSLDLPSSITLTLFP
jgi:predicted RNase H-like nuclease (RuvC/YqgF family)